MNIVEYAAFAYLATAVISLLLIALIVVLNKFMGGKPGNENGEGVE
ncbi:MAG: hypothetical protein I3I94_05700 [Acidaminococcaceae bacterium]|nr:hypothetical protein [Acidaminococcaceae bacterium]